MKISTSFLSINEDVKEKVEQLDNTTADYIHLDVMDGIFVPAKSYIITEMREIVKNCKKPLDVHLMVSDVKTYIDQYRELKPLFLTVSYEALPDTMMVISYIHDCGCKAGLAIKPNTKVEEIVPFLPFLDVVLVMSVEPGKGGQVFLESGVSKVDQLQKLRNIYDYSYIIEVDGGINAENIKKLENADICVVGSYITNGEDYQERIDTLL